MIHPALFAVAAAVLALAGLFTALRGQEPEGRNSSTTPPATAPAAPLPGPGGTVVYHNLTGRNAGPQWTQSPSDDPKAVQPLRETLQTPKGGRKCFGQFVNHTAALSMKDLPPHKFVRVSFDLLILYSWDGNDRVDAGGMAIGPDFWRLAVSGGPTLLNTTFCNTPEVSNKQAYPDDFPFGNHTGQTGSSEHGTLGCRFGTMDLDAVYKLKFAFPHTGDSIKLNFSAFDLQGGDDEYWGLANVIVETLEESPAAALTPRQIADLVAGLEDKDPLKAHESVLTLMCAGDEAVRAIKKRFAAATSRPSGQSRNGSPRRRAGRAAQRRKGRKGQRSMTSSLPTWTPTSGRPAAPPPRR
jgi:hypothetical protein